MIEADKCELRKCKSGAKGTVRVFENIGDGSWLVYICEECAERLGLREFDDLPGSTHGN